MTTHRERRELLALRRFVHAFDPRTGVLPKGLEPGLVERFVCAELRLGRPAPLVAQQLRELADYYDARATGPDFALWLDGREANLSALRASCELAWALAIVGDGALRLTARRYYEGLWSTELAVRDAEQLAQSYLDHALDGPLALAEPIARARATVVRSGEPSDVDPLRGLDQIARSELPWLEAATVRARTIAALPDPSARLDHLVDLYLGIDTDYLEALFRWAVRALQREARALGPGPLIAAFERAAPRIDGAFPVEADGGPVHARAVHALELFGAVLSREQRARVRVEQKARDLLSV